MNAPLKRADFLWLGILFFLKLKENFYYFYLISKAIPTHLKNQKISVYKREMKTSITQLPLMTTFDISGTLQAYAYICSFVGCVCVCI